MQRYTDRFSVGLLHNADRF